MNISGHAVFQIGLKVLLRKDDRVLFLRDAETGRLDLPGGRMDSSEQSLPLTNIIAREVSEELGAITYKLGAPLFQYRRDNKHTSMPVFITIYDAEYISGDIMLSDEHSSYEWVDPKISSFEEKDFGNVEELQAMQAYFNSLKN